jgi:hypothetical protein
MGAQWISSICSKLRVSSLLATAFVVLLPCAAGAQSTAAPSDHALHEASIPLGAGGRIEPKYSYLFSPAAHWVGPLRWKYNHANAPAALASAKAAIIAQIQKSFDKWSSQCGITYAYDGETTAAPDNTQADGQSVIGWGPLDASLGAWTYAWYAQNGNDRVIFDADITLSTTNIASLADLDRLITHEWGHAMGLDHSNTEQAIMAGPPLTFYNQLVTPQSDDLRGCRCLYGVPSGVNAAYACSLPSKLDFGAASVGAGSSPQTVTLTNSGNAALSIQTSTIADPQFKQIAGCMPGSVVMPGQSCTMQIQVTPAASGQLNSKLTLYTNDGAYDFDLSAFASTSANALASTQTVDVVEYYNADLDHYFITWIAAEMANLDAGATPTKWTRTGRSFKAYGVAQSSTSQVCRFYIPPADGNSHFFGRSPSECAASQQAHPDFVLEDPSYMHIVMPAAGTCPSGLQPVFRLFDNRADTNHRYTTDAAVRDAMVAKGWIAEGDGPDHVVMCVPR